MTTASHQDPTHPHIPASNPNPSTSQVQWQQLFESPLNPRQYFDAKTLQELADSILSRGVLQNLIARPAANGRFEIACGARRHRAIGLLIEQGKVNPDYAVPVNIRKLSDLELSTLAAVENTQRDNMSALEEALAYAALHTLGMGTEEIALQTGKSRSTVEKRVTLGLNLCPTAQAMLSEKRINLEQAQALTIGTIEQQEALLKTNRNKGVLSEHGWSARQIRGQLKQNSFDAKHAIFKLEDYPQEHIQRDLYSDVTYLNNAASYHRLQLAAIEKRREKMLKKLAFVELVQHEGYFHVGLTNLAYCSAGDAGAGAVIHYNPNTGTMEVHEHYKQRATATADGTSLGAKPKRVWQAGLLARAHEVKTQTIQAGLLNQEHHALALGILAMLGSDGIRHNGDTQIRPHDQINPTPALVQAFAPYRARLETVSTLHTTVPTGIANLTRHDHKQAVAVYRLLLEFKIEELRELHTILVASRCGAWNTMWEADLPDHPLAVAIAKSLDLKLGNHWTIAETDLRMMSKAQVEEVAKQIGLEPKPNDKKSTMIANILAKPEKLPAVKLEPFKFQLKTKTR